MTFEIWVVFLILALAVVAFVTERVRHDLIGLLVMVLLGLTNVLQPDDLLHGFGNRAVVTIGAMFVLSAALTRTGMVSALSGKLADYSRGNPMRFLVFSLVTVCVMSAFINNTPVVLVFIPAVLTVSAKVGMSPSKFLMPISFASMLGGSCTLIGTSSNILVSSISDGLGQGAIGMFEFSQVGIVIVFAGMGYLLFLSFRLLPDRVTIASSANPEAAKKYVTQVQLARESNLIGKTLGETPFGKSRVSVVELIRGEQISRLGRDTPLELGDILLVRGDLNEILELDRQHSVTITPGLKPEVGDFKRVEMTLFELMIAPDSNLIGQRCSAIGFRQEYEVSIFAIQRRGRHHQREIGEIELKLGDILLVRGSIEEASRLRDSNEFILLEGVHEEREERHKAPIAIATIATIILLASLGVFPISVLSLGGVAVVLLAKLLTPREVYRAVDWPVLVLIAGMIALGDAMGQTGALDLIASQLVSAVGSLGPHATLWIFYIMTGGLSLLILNKPAAALMAPLAVILAQQLNVDPKPFVMAVAFAASTAMATPMGYQTNLLVYGPGGYAFKDFIRFGLPLNLLVGVIACFLIPWVWPF
ncbi:SLC13 family permease [Puniceicoccales bacterium CK1056]|uniref:SLC13 family permease n=1 Tax=Oceanipulchritudo coccoides TaxID=2706888 RepID=A0A6B2LYI2_9BACT|nr:SLC13 family permease [Oceanipulchritudo coccoides]NDV61453.1 SLC13 family permease [Oceanipulchritudo coccoides]